MKINEFELFALIDTGSYVNLVRMSDAKKIQKGNLVYDDTLKTRLTGIAEKEVISMGTFIAKLQIDEYFADIKFQVVKDTDIPVYLEKLY